MRPGCALYGINPTPEADNPMQPVVELKARIVQIRNIERGETVGYGGTWTARRPTRIAIVSAGYADGYFRAASANDGTRGAEVVVAGKRCPIAGRISMDLMAVDVTDFEKNPVRRGHMVTLIGEGITVDELAHHFGTIGYEVMTSLGRRYARIYKGGDAAAEPAAPPPRGAGCRADLVVYHFRDDLVRAPPYFAFRPANTFLQASLSWFCCLVRHATTRPPPGDVPAQNLA